MIIDRRSACLALVLAITVTVAGQEPSSSPGNLILPGETFQVGGHKAFVFLPPTDKRTTPQAWIMYAPTLLPRYPDKHEKWMHQQFLDAGIAVAGIDVGEAYGSPRGNQAISAFYETLVSNRGFAEKPCLLGRSRGGLWVSSWAIKHPEKVAGIAGIYPVFDLQSYPGLKRAAGAYGLTPEQLKDQLPQYNPIERVKKLAEAKVPVLIIHGTDDKVVPIEKNSAELVRRYQRAGKPDLVTLIAIEGQGHNFWEGFFRCKELIEFAKAKALSGTR